MAYGNPLRRLYVLETADGVVKGGIAHSSAEQRIRQHNAKHTIVRHYIGERFVIGVEAERELLRRLATVGSLVRGREWFAGVTFDQAAQMVREVTEQFVHPDPSPQPSPLLRKPFAKLSFNDAELAILDAYCARFGLERGVACRKLAMAAISDLAAGHGAKNFAPATT